MVIQTGGSRTSAFLLIAIATAATLAFTIPMIKVPDPPSNGCSISVDVEKKSDFYITDAELRWYSDHSFISNVYCKVKSVNGIHADFNRARVLRVYFNTLLDNGDIIRIYARYGTTPSIKAVLIENTNWEVVGEGEVLAMWGYYDLVISGLDSPRSSFDIALLPTTPSSNQIRIDFVGCVPHEPSWHDDETGFPVVSYSVAVNYMVTATDLVDTDEVYIDLEFTQTIIDSIGATTIVTTMVQKTTVQVPTVSEWHEFITNDIPIIPHDVAMTDSITVVIDVTGTARGMVTGTAEWIMIERVFTSLREMDFSWY